MSIQPAVLIVEDAESMRESLYEALHAFGYWAIVTATVQEAEEARRRLGSEAIGLVITDVNLSRNLNGQEGYALFRRWTAAYPALPFLLISGAISSRDLLTTPTDGVRFLAKPFDLDELIEAVQALLRNGATTHTGRGSP